MTRRGLFGGELPRSILGKEVVSKAVDAPHVVTVTWAEGLSGFPGAPAVMQALHCTVSGGHLGLLSSGPGPPSHLFHEMHFDFRF